MPTRAETAIWPILRKFHFRRRDPAQIGDDAGAMIEDLFGLGLQGVFEWALYDRRQRRRRDLQRGKLRDSMDRIDRVARYHDWLEAKRLKSQKAPPPCS